MNKNKIHLLLWIVTIILTGITTGFYLSHSLILGQWFTWFVINPEKLPLLYQTYSEFRAEHIPILYQSICALQILVFIIFTIFAILRKYRIRIALIALLFSISAGIIHIGTGFSKLEIDVLSGINRDSISLAKYATLNVPFHITYTFLMFISFLLLSIYYIELKKYE